jgi:hypothetical protein
VSKPPKRTTQGVFLPFGLSAWTKMAGKEPCFEGNSTISTFGLSFSSANLWKQSSDTLNAESAFSSFGWRKWSAIW